MLMEREEKWTKNEFEDFLTLIYRFNQCEVEAKRSVRNAGKQRKSFLNPDDSNFVKLYAFEMFTEHLGREKHIFSSKVGRFDKDFEVKMGDRIQRALGFDIIFRDSNIPAMKMDDKQIVFQCFAIFDRYFQAQF
jgi:hypothetical protein